MYITQIHYWEEKDWDEFFLQFPEINKEQKGRVRQILTMGSKRSIEVNFEYLTEVGVLNGIGPGYLMTWMRRFISLLFKGVKYEWHDIMYAVGGNERDRLNADYGLLKYSKISILQQLITSDYGLISMFFIYIATMIQYMSAYFCYAMVVTFGRWGSFRYYEK